jgi:hypothetical protein
MGPRPERRQRIRVGQRNTDPVEARTQEDELETQGQQGGQNDNPPFSQVKRHADTKGLPQGVPNGVHQGVPHPERQTDADAKAARLQRRRRLHELVLALIGQQGDLELLDGDALLGGNGGSMASRDSAKRDPASWLDHNRRLIQRYQALVRTAATLDALIDQEVGEGRNA